MEHGIQVLYIGAAAVFFAVFMAIWLHCDRQFDKGLRLLEQDMNEERIVSLGKGD